MTNTLDQGSKTQIHNLMSELAEINVLRTTDLQFERKRALKTTVIAKTAKNIVISYWF
jgi:hypothetical protein